MNQRVKLTNKSGTSFTKSGAPMQSEAQIYQPFSPLDDSANVFSQPRITCSSMPKASRKRTRQQFEATYSSNAFNSGFFGQPNNNCQSATENQLLNNQVGAGKRRTDHSQLLPFQQAQPTTITTSTSIAENRELIFRASIQCEDAILRDSKKQMQLQRAQQQLALYKAQMRNSEMGMQYHPCCD